MCGTGIFRRMGRAGVRRVGRVGVRRVGRVGSIKMEIKLLTLYFFLFYKNLVNIEQKLRKGDGIFAWLVT